MTLKTIQTMSIKIIKKGIADSIQNAGQYGYQHLGLQVGGYMDYFSAQLANKIVGNSLNQSLFEIHFPASHFEFEETIFISITGANFIPVLNEKSIPMHEKILVNKGDILQFLQPIQGRIAYLAFTTADNSNQVPTTLIEEVEQLIFNTSPIRFIPGPAWNDLDPGSIQQLLTAHFHTTLQSNRMGFQLEGPAIHTIAQKSYLSAGVTRGTMQLLPNGQIIVLMADHQTVGGYPNLGQIILVDLPRLAQMVHQTPIQFRLSNLSTAHEQYQFIQAQISS
jgi:antagonist of KipI